MGRFSPRGMAQAMASTTCGTTCSGVTKFTLWQLSCWRRSITAAMSVAVISPPSRCWEMSLLWQGPASRGEPANRRRSGMWRYLVQHGNAKTEEEDAERPLTDRAAADVGRVVEVAARVRGLVVAGFGRPAPRCR